MARRASAFVTTVSTPIGVGRRSIVGIVDRNLIDGRLGSSIRVIPRTALRGHWARPQGAFMSRLSLPSSGPTRRQFLGAIGTGLAASVAGPTLLHATDKAGTKRPVVGSGEFTYEVYHDWGV